MSYSPRRLPLSSCQVVWIKCWEYKTRKKVTKKVRHRPPVFLVPSILDCGAQCGAAEITIHASSKVKIRYRYTVLQMDWKNLASNHEVFATLRRYGCMYETVSSNASRRRGWRPLNTSTSPVTQCLGNVLGAKTPKKIKLKEQCQQPCLSGRRQWLMEQSANWRHVRNNLSSVLV